MTKPHLHHHGPSTGLGFLLLGDGRTPLLSAFARKLFVERSEATHALLSSHFEAVSIVVSGYDN